MFFLSHGGPNWLSLPHDARNHTTKKISTQSGGFLTSKETYPFKRSIQFCPSYPYQQLVKESLNHFFEAKLEVLFQRSIGALIECYHLQWRCLTRPKFPLQISRWEIEICTTIWPSFKRWYFKYVILSSKTLSTNLKAKPTFSRSENIPNNEAIFLDFHGINGSTTASGFSYSHTHRIHGTDGVFTWNGCLVGGFNPFEKY